METMGERIARLRGRLGLTQAALGRRCGVSRRTVSDWESGRSRPRPKRLCVLAKALGVAEAYIEQGDVGLYRRALEELMEQLDERLGRSRGRSSADPRLSLRTTGHRTA